MSYRQKINGPMCFVEFEDVTCAAQAIKDLYGHNLVSRVATSLENRNRDRLDVADAQAGLVKGGIRLSYSKNSLGQRGSAHTAGINNSMFGGIAHTVALAGMSSNSNGPNGVHAYGQGPYQSPPTSSYGLQLQHGQAQPSTNGSMPPPSAPISIQVKSPSGSASKGPSHSHSHSTSASYSHLNGNGNGNSNALALGNGSSTSLSPTAQPFTSPRSRYFGGTSPASGSLPPVPASATGATSASSRNDQSYAFQPPHTANPALGSSGGSTGNGNGNGHSNSSGTSATTTSAQFSPMASPIRTPASFSWVSSGAVGVGNGYGGGYEGFAAGLGSLDGAASAWSTGGGSAQNQGQGQRHGAQAYSH